MTGRTRGVIGLFFAVSLLSVRGVGQEERLTEEEAKKKLEAMFNDPEFRDGYPVHVLAEQVAKADIHFFVPYLHHSSSRVRSSVIVMLSRFGRPEFAALFLEMLEDEDHNVAKAAMGCMYQNDDFRAFLAKMDREVVREALVKYLRKSNNTLTALLLAELGETSTADELYEMYLSLPVPEGRGWSFYVRKGGSKTDLLKALMKMEDPRGVVECRKLLSSGGVNEILTGTMAMVYANEKSLMPLLLPLLEDERRAAWTMEGLPPLEVCDVAACTILKVLDVRPKLFKRIDFHGATEKELGEVRQLVLDFLEKEGQQKGEAEGGE